MVAIVATGAVCAQSANDGMKGLESCFRLTRAADAICENPANGAAERLDCLEKARTAQLECLEQVRAGIYGVSPELSKPGETGSAEIRSGSSKPPGKAADAKPAPQGTGWIVSETTSPVDYTPMVTAAIRVPSNVQDAPSTLTIRCRGHRTELMLRTDGTWHASHTGEIEVAYQVNDQPSIKMRWAALADGKAASYKDDAAELLRSLPEDALLKINVLDGTASGHEATFLFAGWMPVREKIAAACKWTPTDDRISSGKR